MSKKLIKSGLIVSFFTLLSRVLGLTRDVIVAKYIGVGVDSDVFFFANKIPNFLRRLFGEGAFAQAFVPVLAEYSANETKKHNEQTRHLIAQVSGTLGVIVTIVTFIGVVASPIIVMLFGFGWFLDWLKGDDPLGKFDLASSLLKITFPYLWFITLTALSGAILNTLGKFAVAAFTPVLLNIAIILMTVYGLPYFEQPAYALAWGVFLGGLIQFLFQIPFLWRNNALVKPQWAWQSEGVSKIRKLMIPALFGVSVTQINLLLDTLIASFLVTGSVSWLYYSDRLLEFPLGLFGIGIATVILPRLSSLHAKKAAIEFSHTIDWAIKIVSFLGWPAMAGLIVLAQPIIIVLFYRGEFDQAQVVNVSYSLIAYMFGLMSFMLIKVLAPGFYSRQDTKTPVKIGIIAMFSNMLLNLMFAPFFAYVGLAIATSCSATINAFLLYQGLKKLGVYQFSKAAMWFQVRITLATIAMAATIYYLSPAVEQWFLMTTFDRIMQLVIDIVGAITVYLVVCIILGVRFSHFKVVSTTD